MATIKTDIEDCLKREDNKSQWTEREDCEKCRSMNESCRGFGKEDEKSFEQFLSNLVKHDSKFLALNP